MDPTVVRLPIDALVDALACVSAHILARVPVCLVLAPPPQPVLRPLVSPILWVLASVPHSLSPSHATKESPLC